MYNFHLFQVNPANIFFPYLKKHSFYRRKHGRLIDIQSMDSLTANESPIQLN